MNKNSAQVFNDKVSLVYEYNKRTPLFARMASIELEKNNTENAIAILNEGIANYPDYPVAYFLLGKAYTIKSNYSNALKFIKKGSELIRSPKTYDYYLREIEAIKKESIYFSKERTFEAELKNEITSSSKEKPIKELQETLTRLTSEIEDANKRISEEKKKLQETTSYSFTESNLIVSETLAKIYVNQREYAEAINIYQKLKLKNPEKTEYFNAKIDDLRIRLESDQA